MTQPVSSTDVQLLRKEIEIQGEMFDELKLEVEALRRVVFALKPDLVRQYDELKSELARSPKSANA